MESQPTNYFAFNSCSAGARSNSVLKVIAKLSPSAMRLSLVQVLMPIS